MGRGCEGNVWHLGSGFATGLGRDDLAKISRVWYGNLVCPFFFCVTLPYGSFPIVERIIPKHQLVAITVRTLFCSPLQMARKSAG